MNALVPAGGQELVVKLSVSETVRAPLRSVCSGEKSSGLALSGGLSATQPPSIMASTAGSSVVTRAAKPTQRERRPPVSGHPKVYRVLDNELNPAESCPCVRNAYFTLNGRRPRSPGAVHDLPR